MIDNLHAKQVRVIMWMTGFLNLANKGRGYKTCPNYEYVKEQGYVVGKSIVEDNKMSLANETIEKAKNFNCNIYIPQDFIAVPEINTQAKAKLVKSDNMPLNLMGVDIGPETIAQYTEILDSSQTVLWNGPVGVFEIPQFSTGTDSIARKLAEITKKGAITVVGGGDSAAAMKKFGLMDKVTHVSTGGGASLELLSGLELIPITLLTEK